MEVVIYDLGGSKMKNLLLISLLMNPLNPYSLEPANQAPSIQVSYKTQEVKEDLWMADDGFIDIKITDDNFKSASVEIDGKSQKIEEESSIKISKSNQFITIVAFDQEGLESIRTIRIHQVESPTLSSSIVGNMTRQSKIDLSYSISDLSDWNLVVSYDGIEDRLEATSSLELSRNGMYDLYLENKENPSLKSNHLVFSYSNQKPSIRLIPSSVYSNQDVEVNVLVEGDFIQSSVLKIRNGNSEQVLENIESLTLTKVEGQDIVYEVEGIVEDSFSESAMDLIQVRIDAQGPNLDLYNGSDRMNDRFIYKNGMNLSVQSDGQVSLSFKQNGMPVYYASLKEALDHLSINDLLEVNAKSFDELGNCSQKTWILQKESLLKPVVTHNMNVVESKDATLSNNQYTINHRTWSIDENQQLHLEQKNQKITRISKPKISVFTKEKGKNVLCRIVLYQSESGEEKFNWIRIDGEKINLKECEKDQFGNTYYEFSSRKSCKVECRAQNKDGKIRTIKKTITYTKKDRTSFLEWIKNWFKRLHG